MSYEIESTENGFIVFEGTYEQDGRYMVRRKSWVAKTPKELGELITYLVSGAIEKEKVPNV